MRLALSRRATVVVAFLLVGCAPAASAVPSAPTNGPSVIVVPPGEVSFAPGASAGPSEGPSLPATSSPSRPPSTASVGLPVRGSARELSSHDVLMAPGPDGSLFVLIPSRSDSTRLARLDPNGRLVAGWPVALTGGDVCDELLPVADGSVRVVCTGPNPNGDMYPIPIAYGFGPDGGVLEGWPVTMHASSVTGRMVGDTLTLMSIAPVGDPVPESQPDAEAAMVAIGRDGTMTAGKAVPIGRACCDTLWTVGPDGTGYGIAWPDGSSESTRVSAFGRDGSLAGWPVSVGGIGVAPAFGPDGRMVMAVGSSASRTTRVVVIDRDGAKTPSDRLPIQTFEVSGDMGCTVGRPRAPLVARDGTTFLYSEMDASIYALDASLTVKAGWPYEQVTPLERARPGLESEHEAGYCPGPVVPGVGPDGSLFLAREPRNHSVGGSLAVIDPNGHQRSGWPVTLNRAGSEFWSVVVGADGTAYALAIEPETGGMSSASILAIAPDSTVRWTTTIVDP